MVDHETKPVMPRASAPFRSTSSPFSDFASQAAEVTSDVVELAELQVKLARLDAAEAVKRVVWPLGFILLAACLAIASLPVIFFGLAGLLQELSGWMPWVCQLIVGVIGIVIAIAIAASSLRTISRAFNTFERSSQELSKNIAWFKSIFRKT